MSSAESANQKTQKELRAAGRIARANLSGQERFIASEKIAEKYLDPTGFSALQLSLAIYQRQMKLRRGRSFGAHGA
jgi:hypothetical protein